MPGDPGLGTVLRELRTARGMTLATVARQAGCAESLLSYVETGRRQLHPWLATQLDAIYETGGAIAALLRDGQSNGRPGYGTYGVPPDDVLMVQLPKGGATVPVSRRELLAGLGVGALGTALGNRLDKALANLEPADDPLLSFEHSFAGFRAAARVLPPTQLVNALTGQVAILDALRHRAPNKQRARYAILQARYAESLSWLSEEAGDRHSALYWTDRAAQWAQGANWLPMVAYSFVRRSMMAISFASDGLRAVDTAQQVIEMPGAPARAKGLAAKQMAFGYALARDSNASARALDEAVQLLAVPVREDEAALGQHSVVSDDLYLIFRTTCDIYLGRGDSVIPVLEPRLDTLSKASARTATITRAKLARAYANAGHPGTACRLAWETLDAIDAVGSLSAQSELWRSLPVLRCWRSRSDVQDVVNRLGPAGSPSA